MILYVLTCDQGHQYESWFKDSAAFETLQQAGHLQCEVCGSKHVSKAITAPRLSAAVGAEKRNPAPSAPTVPARAPSEAQMVQSETRPALSAQEHQEIRQMLRHVQEHVERNFDHVGPRFAEEARAIHAGQSDERGIYGEASVQDVKELLEDGIDVAPLPFGRKNA